MSVTFFKRYRMLYELAKSRDYCGLPMTDATAGAVVPDEWQIPGFEALPWDETDRDRLIRWHGKAKYLSFREEMDSLVFACLGDQNGCLRLMREIVSRNNFIDKSTWLIRHQESGEFCGTIQALMDGRNHGSIQNVGVTPQFRGRGLGRMLLALALRGMKASGMRTASLEVTAQNHSAIRLYARCGFVTQRVVYKPVENGVA